MLTLLAQTPAQPASGDLGTFVPPTTSYSLGSQTAQGATSNFELLISNGIGAITIVGGLFFVIYFVMAAFAWVTAGGDAGKVQKARDKMVLGIIGLVMLIMSYGLIGLVGRVLGLELLKPGEMILQIAPTP